MGAPTGFQVNDPSTGTAGADTQTVDVADDRALPDAAERLEEVDADRVSLGGLGDAVDFTPLDAEGGVAQIDSSICNALYDDVFDEGHAGEGTHRAHATGLGVGGRKVHDETGASAVSESALKDRETAGTRVYEGEGGRVAFGSTAAVRHLGLHE